MRKPKPRGYYNATRMGRRLEWLRARRNQNCYQAAAEIGVTNVGLRNWERGLREPTCSTLVLLSRYYGVSVDWLIFGDDGD